jgi:DNA-binding protein HU-beta
LLLALIDEGSEDYGVLNNMNKDQLIRSISNGLGGMPLVTVRKVVDALISNVQVELSSDGVVRLIGLGTFSVKARSARKGYSVQSKTMIDIPSRRVAHFAPSEKLSAQITQ